MSWDLFDRVILLLTAIAAVIAAYTGLRGYRRSVPDVLLTASQVEPNSRLIRFRIGAPYVQGGDPWTITQLEILSPRFTRCVKIADVNRLFFGPTDAQLWEKIENLPRINPHPMSLKINWGKMFRVRDMEATETEAVVFLVLTDPPESDTRISVALTYTSRLDTGVQKRRVVQTNIAVAMI